MTATARRVALLLLGLELATGFAPRLPHHLPAARRTTAAPRPSTVGPPAPKVDVASTEFDGLVMPNELVKALQARNVTSLLSVQRGAFDTVRGGRDAVIHSPTGSGKTLSFVLPLTARLLEDPAPPGASLNTAHRDKLRAIGRATKGGSSRDSSARPAAPPPNAVSPRVVVLAPSRELCRQIGREWRRYFDHSMAVFGGVPVQRQAAALRGGGGTEVVIATAGRLRELIREKVLDFNRLETLVLDEADMLLDQKDQPDVAEFLDSMDHDYQLVLCSATINKLVKRFVVDVMEVEEDTFITVSTEQAVGKTTAPLTDDHLAFGEEAPGVAAGPAVGVRGKQQQRAKQAVLTHEGIPVKHSARSEVAADVIAIKNPRKALVFAASKAEVEWEAESLSRRLGATTTVHILHGDLPQTTRSRTMAAFRSDDDGGGSTRQRILVATDVAARGLDVPTVDLVVQFGVPRKSGKEGTFDPELYTHRTGRAGRGWEQDARNAHAVLMFDPTAGESKLIEKLEQGAGVNINLVPPPSPQQTMEAAFARAVELCGQVQDPELVDFFHARVDQVAAQVVSDASGADGGNTSSVLARALAALSGLTSLAPARSLLNANPTERTVRVAPGSDQRPLTPTDVVKMCKGLGTNKIPRISTLFDGSAVFDLPTKKANALVNAAAASPDNVPEGWTVAMPGSLPLEPPVGGD